ncbi:MAG: hypothetical protein AAFU70_03685, partial [Planctomycetota bacterium]
MLLACAAGFAPAQVRIASEIVIALPGRLTAIPVLVTAAPPSQGGRTLVEISFGQRTLQGEVLSIESPEPGGDSGWLGPPRTLRTAAWPEDRASGSGILLVRAPVTTESRRCAIDGNGALVIWLAEPSRLNAPPASEDPLADPWVPAIPAKVRSDRGFRAAVRPLLDDPVRRWRGLLLGGGLREIDPRESFEPAVVLGARSSDSVRQALLRLWRAAPDLSVEVRRRLASWAEFDTGPRGRPRLLPLVGRSGS